MPRYAHFLLSGIASIVTSMQDGGAIEVSLLGNEGFPECLHVLGPQFGTMSCFMQISGQALRMELGQLRTTMQGNPALLKAVHGLVQSQALALAQMGACNRLHDATERLARWLLMVYDRVGQAELRTTQEALAAMIGSRRPTVSLAMGVLQDSGWLDYSRGRIVIQNPESLANLACECYAPMRRLYQNLYR